MCISEELLRSIGATEQYYSAGDYLFRQDTLPQFYFYIMEGRIKLNKYAEDGKEFIQDIIDRKSGAGESMLVLGKPYPVNAVALSECTVLKVAGTQFFTLLRDQPSVFRDIYSRLADSTFEKQTLIHTITSRTAEDRLIEILNLMKESQEKKDKFSLEINYTRQQLASLSGLSLETAIRIIKKMEKENIIRLDGTKILY